VALRGGKGYRIMTRLEAELSMLEHKQRRSTLVHERAPKMRKNNSNPITVTLNLPNPINLNLTLNINMKTNMDLKLILNLTGLGDTAT